jgi:hypothetical protein
MPTCLFISAEYLMDFFFLWGMASLSSPGRSQAQARTYIPQIHHPRAWAGVMILAPTTTSKLSNELVFLQRDQLKM